MHLKIAVPPQACTLSAPASLVGLMAAVLPAEWPGRQACSAYAQRSPLKPYPQRASQAVSFRWWGIDLPLQGLQGLAYYYYFPTCLQQLQYHDTHPCQRVATAGTVHEMGAALLAELFLSCELQYRMHGYKLLWDLIPQSGDPEQQEGQQQWNGQVHYAPPAAAAPAWVASKAEAADEAGRQHHIELWNGLSRQEQAALLLFVSPPVRVGKPTRGAARESCIRVYNPRQYRWVR